MKLYYRGYSNQVRQNNTWFCLVMLSQINHLHMKKLHAGHFSKAKRNNKQWTQSCRISYHNFCSGNWFRLWINYINLLKVQHKLWIPEPPISVVLCQKNLPEKQNFNCNWKEAAFRMLNNPHSDMFKASTYVNRKNDSHLQCYRFDSF